MQASVDWGPTKHCLDENSPPITLTGVPAGTVTLDIRMKDLDYLRYPHGGGKVAYAGQSQLPYGAFRYKGPCPPNVSHLYEFTIRALDAAGKELATAKTKKRFP
ncbi:phospholipid-binding protein [Propylenella binzhouense]|uniref:Phospholipid-binding protein n=1 Tax=Propylenella binzhouense TaxID=2555902 RepID=A0A964T9G2_9HYPH|nr:phospholipid-binding protein [Propylenella binzhouense]MYZ50234.1 phospholipid-binding protein [Propylenella binzhouense]